MRLGAREIFARCTEAGAEFLRKAPQLLRRFEECQCGYLVYADASEPSAKCARLAYNVAR